MELMNADLVTASKSRCRQIFHLTSSDMLSSHYVYNQNDTFSHSDKINTFDEIDEIEKFERVERIEDFGYKG